MSSIWCAKSDLFWICSSSSLSKFETDQSFKHIKPSRISMLSHVFICLACMIWLYRRHWYIIKFDNKGRQFLGCKWQKRTNVDFFRMRAKNPQNVWTKSNKNGHCEYAWDYYNCFAVLLMTKYQSQIISKKFRSLPINLCPFRAWYLKKICTTVVFQF